MYQYEVKYLTDGEWHTYTTMLYAEPGKALMESEKFEASLNCQQLSKRLIQLDK